MCKIRLKALKVTESVNLTENKMENSAKLPKVSNLSCILHLQSKESQYFGADSKQMAVSPS